MLHNAAPQADGTWAWRYDRNHLPEGAEIHDFGGLWDAVDAVDVRLTLLRGSESPVVDDAAVAERLVSALMEEGNAEQRRSYLAKNARQVGELDV